MWALGVIEHIGTQSGHCTLAEHYEAARQNYANEILRVAKSGGRIIIACTNLAAKLVAIRMCLYQSRNAKKQDVSNYRHLLRYRIQA
ncbi:MAG: hypothetical protein NVSMB56_08610 [Pyrinomonadaceae bacterium]